jgi:hypothetical protein
MGSVKGFKSYSNLKFYEKSKMAAQAAILDIQTNFKSEIIALGGLKMPTKFQLDRSKGLKFIAI